MRQEAANGRAEVASAVLPMFRKKYKRSEGFLRAVYKELLEAARSEIKERRTINYCCTKFILEDFGRLGRVILLLYCANLFCQDSEQEKCISSSGGAIQKWDLQGIVETASSMTTDTSEIDEILDQVVATSYFDEEDLYSASPVLALLQDFVPMDKQLTPDEFKKFLRVKKKTLQVYKDFSPCSNSKRLKYLEGKRSSPSFPSLKDKQLATLVTAVMKSSTMACLMARRPSNCMFPHAFCVIMCAEHAMLWLHKSKLRIFYPLPITYEHLHNGVSQDQEASLRDLWNNRVAAEKDLILRTGAVELMNKDTEEEGDLYVLQPDDFPAYMKRDLSPLHLEVAKMILPVFRSKPKQLDYTKSCRADVSAVLAMADEYGQNPQYAHLYGPKRVKKENADSMQLQLQAGLKTFLAMNCIG